MKTWKLEVPYSERKEAKEMGCRWDWNEMCWCFSGSEDDYKRLPERWTKSDEGVDDFVVFLPF